MPIATLEPDVLDAPLTLTIPDEITNVETVQQLTEAATPYFAKAEPLCIAARKIVVTDAADTEGMQAARETRLALREIRVDAEKARKTLKEESLRKGKAIDAVFNGFRDALSTHEEYLAQQEQFAERLLAEQKARVKAERDAELVAIGANPEHYNAGDMSDEAFSATLAGLKAQKKVAEEQAKAEAEAKRLQEIEDAKERARVAEENERLREEAAEREKAMAAERQAAADERERIEAAARAEREKAEAAAADDRRKREAAERELREKEAAESKRIADEKRVAAKARRAPDKVKVLAMAETLRGLPRIGVKSEEAQAIADEINRKIITLAHWIEQQAESL